MAEPAVSEARLCAILAAYGADPRRWPPDERVEAERRLTLSGAALAAARREADDLDFLLLAQPAPVGDAALRRKIVASANAMTVRAGHSKLWWAGAGFAGLGVTGALAGAMAVAVIGLAEPAPGPAYTVEAAASSGATVFGDLDGSES